MYKMENNSNMKTCTNITFCFSKLHIWDRLGRTILSVIPRLLGLRLCFQYKGDGFHPCLRNYDSTCCRARPKNKQTKTGYRQQNKQSRKQKPWSLCSLILYATSSLTHPQQDTNPASPRLSSASLLPPLCPFPSPLNYWGFWPVAQPSEFCYYPM